LRLSTFARGIASTAGMIFTIDPISCPAYPTTDDVEFTTSGGTSLRYDFTSGQFIQHWKTPAQQGCYSVTMTYSGQTISANFQTK
jgi:hypothetical protein